MTFFGYLDPGTGTLIVQTVLGGVAGAAVLLKTRGRRLLKRNTGGEDAGVEAGDGAPQNAPVSPPAD